MKYFNFVASHLLCLATSIRLPILQVLCCKTSQNQFISLTVRKQWHCVAPVLQGDPKPLVTVDEKEDYCCQTCKTAGCCVLSPNYCAISAHMAAPFQK